MQARLPRSCGSYPWRHQQAAVLKFISAKNWWSSQEALEETKAEIPRSAEVQAKLLAQTQLYLESIRLIVGLLETCLNNFDAQTLQISSLQQQVSVLQSEMAEQNWCAKARTAIANLRKRIALSPRTTWLDLLRDLQKEEDQENQPAMQKVLIYWVRTGSAPQLGTAVGRCAMTPTTSCMLEAAPPLVTNWSKPLLLLCSLISKTFWMLWASGPGRLSQGESRAWWSQHDKLHTSEVWESGDWWINLYVLMPYVMIIFW